VQISNRIPKPKVSNWRPAVLALGFLASVILAGFAGAWLENQTNDPSTSLTQQRQIVTGESRLISQIAKSVGPSVVSVNVNITTTSDAPADPFGLFGFAQPQAQTARAAGTGIILSSDGVILTNRHVVPDGTTKVSVTLSDGTELKDVSVLGRTSDNDTLDVAFLKVHDLKGKKLQPATIGRSSTLQVGDNVVAIGNALGEFQNTVTSGIVSGFGRSVAAGDSSDSSAVENLSDLIQTDAAINEGNSGGPLVNLNGAVVGLNTAIAGGAQNIGFAIPIDDIHGLIEQVLKTGHFARPYLGVRYVSLSPSVADELNLKTNDGAFIAPAVDSASPSVIAGGPADKAGLKERDIITAVDGAKIDQSHSLTSRLAGHKPGDRIVLTVLRDGRTIDVSITLGTLPADQ